MKYMQLKENSSHTLLSEILLEQVQGSHPSGCSCSRSTNIAFVENGATCVHALHLPLDRARGAVKLEKVQANTRTESSMVPVKAWFWPELQSALMGSAATRLASKRRKTLAVKASLQRKLLMGAFNYRPFIGRHSQIPV